MSLQPAPSQLAPSSSSLGPSFTLPASCVTTLDSPSAFYAALLAGCASSSSRITLSSLYLGTGALEQRLAFALRDRVAAVPSLRVALHFDHSRTLRPLRIGASAQRATRTALHDASRDAPFASDASHTLPDAAPPTTRAASTYSSCASLLLEITRGADGRVIPDVAARVRVGLALLPQLRGVLGRIVPPRVVEAGGVWHAKAYVFDAHTVILTGANLSEDYFTNRQDRYLLVRAAPSGAGNVVRDGVSLGDCTSLSSAPCAAAQLADYLHGVIDGVASLTGSHCLLPDGTVAVVPESPLSSEPSPLASCPRAAADSNDLSLPSTGALELVRRWQQLPFLPPLVHPRSRAVLSPLGSVVSNAAAPICSAAAPECSAASLPPVVSSPLPLGSRLNALYSRGLRVLLDEASFRGLPGDDALAAPPLSVLVRPRWQLGLLGVRWDELALLHLLKTQRHSRRDGCGDAMHMATGYFNLPRSLQAAIIGASRQAALPPLPTPHGTCVHILTAAPEANGFWGAAGIAGAVPLAYCQLERAFYRAVARAGRLMRDPEGDPDSAGVAIHEYTRPGWTFHAKGVWRYSRGSSSSAHLGAVTGAPALAPSSTASSTAPDSSALPHDTMCTLAGSPNYGQRGLARDCELQLEFLTAEPGLVQRFLHERDELFGRHAGLPPATQRAGPWTRAVGPHLVASGSARYGADRDVWSPAVAHRWLRWRLSWSQGVWIRVGARVLAGFF